MQGDMLLIRTAARCAAGKAVMWLRRGLGDANGRMHGLSTVAVRGRICASVAAIVVVWRRRRRWGRRWRRDSGHVFSHLFASRWE